MKHVANRVDFLIGGTQKGGTTALDAYMRMHPSVLMADRKEVHFFDNEEHFLAVDVDYAAYHASFKESPPGKLLGEATPIYMYWSATPRRVAEYNPEMKWILLLRNPVERAYSQWNMERNRGAESLPFLDAVKCEQERCDEALPLQHRVYSYVSRGMYVEQIRRIWQYFPADQTLLIKSEVLHQRPEESLRQITNFLGIDPFPASAKLEAHLGEYASPLKPDERAYLDKLFEREIRSLEELVGWDCSDWV